ncbi:MAG: metallophosphoesterase, partial [Oscillospiraceae bacterium]
MKLHILSDLHLDHSAFIPPQTDADVTIFAGDLHGGPSSLEYAHDHAELTKKPAIYVAGNHEFYGRDIK